MTKAKNSTSIHLPHSLQFKKCNPQQNPEFFSCRRPNIQLQKRDLNTKTNIKLAPKQVRKAKITMSVRETAIWKTPHQFQIVQSIFMQIK